MHFLPLSNTHLQEVAEGKLQIDAAKAAGVKGVVWSGLASVSKLSGGKYTHVYSFDSKALVTEYGRQAGVPFVEVRCGPYASAFSRPPFAPMRKSEGVYTLAWPLKADSKINIVDTAEDYGLFVRHVLELETFPDGDEFLAYSEVITPTEIAEQWSKGASLACLRPDSKWSHSATGKTIQFTPIPAEMFKMGLEKSGKVPPPLVLSLSDLTSSWAEFPCQYKFITSKRTFYRLIYISVPTKPIPEGLGRPLRTWAEYAKITDWSKVLV